MNFIQTRQKRLRQLKKQRPQLAEIFDFYAALYQYLARQEQPFIKTAPAANPDPALGAEGFPLLRGDSLQIEVPRAIPFMAGLIEVFLAGGQQGQQELATLKAAVTEGRLDLLALFRACLERNRRPLHEQADQIDVPAALLEYVFNTALSYALQRAREEGLQTGAEGWTHGYCPLCGGLPAMSELTGEDGQRRLHCGTCGSSWDFPRLQCIYCGNRDRDTLEYFTAEGDTGHRVDVCRKCSCYLKGADARELGDDLPMDIEDFSTLHLDLLAQREGFTRGKQGKADAA